MINTHELSVVIPAFNAAETIETAVQSAFDSGAREVIVVDDGSTDATSRLAAAAGAISIVQENSGASRARARGGAVASMPFVIFLDADDVLIPAGVNESVRIVLADQTASVAAGRVIGFSGASEGALLPRSLDKVDTVTLLVEGHGAWPPGAAVLRKTALDAASRLDVAPLAPRFAEDYELLIRLSRVGGVLTHEIPSLRYEMSGGKSVRSASNALADKERIRAHYAAPWQIPILMMAPARLKAAARKRRSRASLSSGRYFHASWDFAVACLWGGVSVFQTRKSVGKVAE